MAGLNLLLKKNKESNTVRINSNFCPDILTNQDVWLNEGLELTIHKHKGYPYKTYSNDKYDVFIEGKVYNLNEENLLPLLEKLFHELVKITPNKQNISDLLFKLDGDFILVFYDKINQKTYLLNDLYGRLPIYYSENEENFMISRNIEVISNTLGINELDKYGVAEFLVFGYTVTERTLLKGIHYFLPGSLLSFDAKSKSVNIQNIFTFNFESLLSVTKETYQEELNDNVRLFKKAVLERTTTKSVVGLSGGLDSRILAAALKQVQSESESLSRLSFNNREKKDVVLAKQISEVLNLDFQVVKSEEPDISYINKIIKLKSGLNSIENDYNLIFEEKLAKIYGNGFTYFTGDAGDRIKPHINIRNAKNLDDFVSKLILNNSRFVLTQVSYMLGIDADEFTNNIRRYIQTFPEKSFSYRDLHFRIYSRGFRYVLEGEDRKRNYFWTVMPFYSHEFFLSAMSFPDYFKKDYKMFIDFMNILEPRLSQVVNKNWGLRPDDWRLPIYLKKYDLSAGFRRQIKKLLSKVRKKELKIANDDLKRLLEENNIYTKEEYQKALNDKLMDYSKILFIRTPVLLDKHLNNK